MQQDEIKEIAKRHNYLNAELIDVRNAKHKFIMLYKFYPLSFRFLDEKTKEVLVEDARFYAYFSNILAIITRDASCVFYNFNNGKKICEISSTNSPFKEVIESNFNRGLVNTLFELKDKESISVYLKLLKALITFEYENWAKYIQRDGINGRYDGDYTSEEFCKYCLTETASAVKDYLKSNSGYDINLEKLLPFSISQGLSQ